MTANSELEAALSLLSTLKVGMDQLERLVEITRHIKRAMDANADVVVEALGDRNELPPELPPELDILRERRE